MVNQKQTNKKNTKTSTTKKSSTSNDVISKKNVIDQKEVKSIISPQQKRELKVLKAKNKEEITKLKNSRVNAIKEEKNKFKKLIRAEKNSTKRNKLKDDYIRKFSDLYEPNAKGEIITIRNLDKYYCNDELCEHILKDVNLSVKKGDFVVIYGVSGSGKTTLLNIMSGLVKPDHGSIVINNKNLFYANDSKLTKFRREDISIVFQSYNLIPTLTAFENINVGYNIRNKDKKTDSDKIDFPNLKEIINFLGLKGQEKKYPYQLSGGQNQRISIGRAIAKNPTLLFADEPTGALDQERGDDIIKILKEINKKFKTTIVLITHNEAFKKHATKVVRVKNGKINEV